MAANAAVTRGFSRLVRSSVPLGPRMAVRTPMAAPARAFSSSAQTAPSRARGAIAGSVAALGAYLLVRPFGTIKAESAPALTKEMDWTPFTVKEVEFITPNTGIFRFALPDGKERLGMTTASFLMTRVKVGDKPDGTPDYAIRPYTPVSEDGHGYFDLIVKKYPTGVLSSHIHSLKPGDKLEFKGPLVKFVYKPNEIPQITMIAGGSGITPMIQVAREVLSNPNDKTHVNLLFANQTEDDIICRDLLDAWAARYKDRFHLYYTLDKAPEGWKQGKGFITEEMLAGKLPAPGSGGRVLVCGPPGMMKHVSGDKAPDKSQGELSGLLKKMGYTEAEVFKF